MSDDLGPKVYNSRFQFYERPLYRPNIHILRAIVKMFLPMVLIALLVWGATQLWQPDGWPIPPVAVGLILEAVYVLLRLKSIEIWLVRVYQRFAPDDLRHLCQYTPSCSEYMILSIEKYGPCRGVVNGYHRLTRCGTEGVCEDWP